MPINTLEQHPFLNYTNDFEYDVNKTRGLILGSFPIYGITDILNYDLKVVENKDDVNNTFMRFFYGSKKSEFWKLLSAVFQKNDFKSDTTLTREQKKQQAIQLLNENNLIISDCIAKTNRINSSAADKDLLIETDEVPDWIIDNLELNNDLFITLNAHPNITTLYFTSIVENGSSPYYWFYAMATLEDKNAQVFDEYRYMDKLWSKKIRINNSVYNLIFLPTPKNRSLAFTTGNQHPMFKNYLQSIDKNFHQQIIGRLNNLNPNEQNQLSDYRTEFLIECYRQALVFNNVQFNGANILR